MECGGTITGDVTFTLPGNPRSFPSQFPVKALFSLEDYPTDAATRASEWRAYVLANITAGKDALLALAGSGLGKTVTTI